jgi:DnaK suppressor protein
MAEMSVASNVVSRTRQTGARAHSAQGLTKKQLNDLEQKLIALRAELHDNIEEKADFVVNFGHQAENVIKGDDAEVAEKQRVSNAALQELDILKGRLQLVERALNKIEDGTYGYCEETEEPIGVERLTVIPWARFCVQVQEKRERNMRDFKVARSQAEL